MKRNRFILLTTVMAILFSRTGWARPEEPPMARKTIPPLPAKSGDEALKYSLEPPPAIPNRNTEDRAELLRRLQAEIEAIKKAMGETGSEPSPPMPLPPPRAVTEPKQNESDSERAQLKKKLNDLIGELKRKMAPAPAPKIDPTQLAELLGDRTKPVDRLKQIQTLFRAGEFESAKLALQLINPTDLTIRQALHVKYLRASAHRRLGELELAKQLYKELASSKEDPFLAEAAAWQLQAIRTREAIEAQSGTTGNPGEPR